MNSLTQSLPVLLSSTLIPQRNVLNAGPRIGKVDKIRMSDGSIVTVNHWYGNDGRLLYVR